MTHAVLYARFSPRPNASECESIDRQLEDLVAYCDRMGWAVRDTFDDAGVSGAEMERDGLSASIAALKRGDVLLVRNIDRLARDNLFSEMIQREVTMRGARVVSAAGEGTLDDTAEQRFVRQIFQAFAELQRSQISERTKKRMLIHQANGRRMSDRTPYGTRRDPADATKLILDDDEQRTIERIVELRGSEEGETPGYRAIARHLDAEGRQCRGHAWHHSMVKRVLERTLTTR